jgi:hypothetical protein
MTDDVSRRNFVALAGAGVTLAACGKPNHSASADETSNLSRFSNKPFGPPPHHGIPTSKKRPVGAATNLFFNPEYLSAIYLRFGRNGQDRKLLAYHGYEKIPAGSTSSQIQNLAERILLEARQTSPGAWRRANNAASNKWRREENLENFDFDSQNLMFVMVDHGIEDIKFDDRPTKGSNPPEYQNLVRFTSVLAQSDSNELDYDMAAQPNNSFLNARIVPAADNALKNRKILVLENWYTDLNGTPISGKPKLRYSMNINLLIATDANKWLPMIIDPDTGNGMGNTP